MSALDADYPIDCPFCAIASAYPASTTSAIPIAPDADKVSPQCHLILSTPHVLAFLDILPIAPGHVLLTTRDHHVKLSGLHTPRDSGHRGEWTAERARTRARDSARALGEWLPLVSRALCAATGVEDWNVVQNNGERAAQVVPHIHFHFIPRYQEGRRDREGNGKVDVGMLKSWQMFGRGSREELDDEEGAALAKDLREKLREEIGEGPQEGAVGKSKL